MQNKLNNRKKQSAQGKRKIVVFSSGQIQIAALAPLLNLALRPHNATQAETV